MGEHIRSRNSGLLLTFLKMLTWLFVFFFGDSFSDANDVSSIPAEISELSNLKFLSLRESRCVTLRHVTPLYMLASLFENSHNSCSIALSGSNALSSIPTDIRKLTSLEKLQLGKLWTEVFA